MADAMAERGLRLRRELEEVIEGWAIEGMSGSEDEMEEDAKELRRLMPY
jgi:hypothetical protein